MSSRFQNIEALKCKAEPELDGCMYANVLIDALQAEIDRLKIVVVENNQLIQYLNEMLSMERNRISNLQSRLMERY
jgi:hypothetical protein